MNRGRKQLHSFLNFVSLNRPINHRWVMLLYHIICTITGQSQCIRCGHSFLCLEKTCCWGSPLFGQLGLFVVPVQVWEYHMTVSLDMMELSLPCAQAMGTTQSKVCLDGASGKHSGYDHWTQCRRFLESRWKAIPSRKMQLACSFPKFPSFHIISYHFPHPQHPGHCKTASSVETRSLRSKLTGVSGAVRHCNYH